MSYAARDKVYSPFDESNTDIYNNFVEICLEFIKTYFDKIKIKTHKCIKIIKECAKVLDANFSY